MDTYEVSLLSDMETNRDNHRSDRIIKKCQRIAGLKALLEEWELSDNLDLDYIRGLRARLLSVQNQLKNISGRKALEGQEFQSLWGTGT
jgi:hypothetical protein